MRFTRFIIRNYRAIIGPLDIDLRKRSLLPVIGVNECGKTTILHAIFSFDYFNDELNDKGRHLKDTSNLYRTSSPPPTITAEIELEEDKFLDSLEEFKAKPNLVKAAERYKRKRRDLPPTIQITRNLSSKDYTIEGDFFSDAGFNNDFAKELIRRVPYILYFDDFRDSIEERIKIEKNSAGVATGWLSIIEQLFTQTDPNFSVFKLHTLEERQRKSVLAKVKRKLNDTLTKEWQNFRLDDADALQISIDFEQRIIGTTKQQFLKLDVVETDAHGDEHYFFIRDRSKGFFWFFNFVMKLEFNPKVLGDDENTSVYLLDEPGSFLHASAQSKLCAKLRQLAVRNQVIYCTHSHYLLDPDVIPLSSIRVADKDGRGNIQLIPINEHRGNILERRSAFQPVIDALQIKPFLLDLNQERVIITEGIYDYYALEMLKQNRNIGILPSVGADSVSYYISLMIAWRVPYCALWDNDEEGRRAKQKAEQFFGAEVAAQCFYMLPKRSSRNRIMQDLFAGDDIAMIKTELALPRNTAFEKVIATLFFDLRRLELVGRFSQRTRENFEQLFASLNL